MRKGGWATDADHQGMDLRGSLPTSSALAGETLGDLGVLGVNLVCECKGKQAGPDQSKSSLIVPNRGESCQETPRTQGGGFRKRAILKSCDPCESVLPFLDRIYRIIRIRGLRLRWGQAVAGE